jgi:hypothetical protein
LPLCYVLDEFDHGVDDDHVNHDNDDADDLRDTLKPRRSRSNGS